MATPSKFDLFSGSPDRPLYTSGPRASYMAAAMDRSSSFRESMENPILSSLPNMSRSSSAIAQGDVMSFFQCLRFDPKLVSAEHKSNRQGDFKRHISVALGISLDDSPSGSSKGKLLPSPSSEELKWVKAALRDSSIKARERVKIFNEALFVLNKFLPTKKRSRSDVFPSDRSSALSSGDRSVLGPSLGKIGSQSHAITSGFELEQQKSEERTKAPVLSKRTRTSLGDVRMDVRSNAAVRPSGALDRDREMLRLSNSGVVLGEDRSLSIGVDGWGEKPKMKKKRTGIKPDVSSGTGSTRPIDCYRESKQGMQQKPSTDARSRLNNDSHGFRPGVSNGAVGVGKSDGISQVSQQSGLGMRSSIPRPESDNSSLLNDRRDRPIGSEKERVNIRAVNKTNVRDDFNSASPTSNTKTNASVRAPRSGSSGAPKLSPVVHRATVTNDWDLSHCTNKPPAAIGANNRKRVASTRSSSPPVAHWAGQRPQKISRTARRTNFVPIVSSNDESSALEYVSDVVGNEIGLGFARRLPGSSPQQVKLKGDPLSESEESGPAEIKSRDKGKKSDEMEQKAGQNVQKVSTMVLPSRKNKMVMGEDIGDGVRRQGRSGRGSTSTRSLTPMTVEKLGNVRTAKQLRSARLGLDKTESKPGRPPTRKLSDRKAYTRQRHTAINAAPDFLVGSDDGHEELLAAANDVINPTHAFPSSFWRQVELFFGFISDEDIVYLKQQENIGSIVPVPSSVLLDADGCSTAANGFGLMERERETSLTTETSNVELLLEQLIPGTEDNSSVSLCQRLIAALVPEANLELGSSGNEDFKFDAYGTGFELEGEFESDSLNHSSPVSFQFTRHAAYNGYRVTGNPEHDDPETNIMSILDAGSNSKFCHSLNGLLSDQVLMGNMACSEIDYDNMHINERLLLEIQSIGIFPELVPDIAQIDDKGISEEINKLEDKLHGQVSRKKGLLDKLLESASEAKVLQEKEFEQRALDKLVGISFEKYMVCWGPNATGGKSSSNKIAKQAALAFVKQTLDRCHKFEDTGKSCFNEPLFRDMFFSWLSHLNGARSIDTTAEGETAKQYAYTSNRSLDARVSASIGSQQSPLTSRFGQNVDNHDINSSDVLVNVNHSSEEITGKEVWSNRVKKRELLLDDVVGGTIVTSASAPLGVGNSLSSSTKGKRSERDREGKGHSREVLSRNGATKIGRPALSNAKGERRPKTKPKQKTQLSVSVNGLLGKISEQPKLALPSASKSREMTSNSAKQKEFSLDVLDDPESIDITHLQLPGMDALDVPEDLGGQEPDLGSWFSNIDDDGLQDHDFIGGLEIPMDDLSELNMMV